MKYFDELAYTWILYLVIKDEGGQISLIVFCSFCSNLSLLNFSLSTVLGVDFVRLLDLGPDFPQILRNSILDNLDNNFCKILSAFKVNLPGK